MSQAQETKTRKKFVLTDVTKFPVMQIQYVGPLDFATVEIEAGGSMLFLADNIDGETTVDPDIGYSGAGAKDATGIIDLATPHASMNTFGELERHINSMANWRCYLIGVLRSQNTDDKLDTRSAVSVRTDNGVTFFADEAKAGNLDQGFAITNQRFTFRPSKGWETRRRGFVTDKLCINALEYLSLNVTAIGNSNIEIYSIDDNDPDNVSVAGNLIWELALVTATLTLFGGTTPVEEFIAGHRGHRLLVFFDCAAAATAAAINVVGNTEQVTGGMVQKENYTGLI